MRCDPRALRFVHDVSSHDMCCPPSRSPEGQAMRRSLDAVQEQPVVKLKPATRILQTVRQRFGHFMLTETTPVVKQTSATMASDVQPRILHTTRQRDAHVMLSETTLVVKLTSATMVTAFQHRVFIRPGNETVTKCGPRALPS